MSRWLGARGLDASALDEAAGEAFLADRRAAGRSLLLRIGSLAPLLEYLSGIGAAPAPGPVPPATPADALLARYAGDLATERGLSAKTIARNVMALRPFLAGLAREEQPDLGLGRLTAREVMDFVVGQSRQRPGTVPHLVTALRSLLRFLHVGGVTASRLADAVPAAAGRKLAGLPKALPRSRWPAWWRHATRPRPWAAVTWRSCCCCPASGCGPARPPACGWTTSTGGGRDHGAGQGQPARAAAPAARRREASSPT